MSSFSATEVVGLVAIITLLVTSFSARRSQARQLLGGDYGRMARRDAAEPMHASGLNGSDSAKLARLEQAVDAIAIEVERLGESQRFLTKVLTEKRAEPGDERLKSQ